MSDASEPAYVTIQAFCDLCGLGQTSIYAALRRGDIEAIRVGRRTLINSKQALRWLASQPRWTPSAPVALRQRGTHPSRSA